MSANPFAEVDEILSQSKGKLSVENCSGANCGDALANFLNSGPLKDTGYSLPRGGVGPGDLASVGKARGSAVYNKENLTPETLTPGTVIHMTRQPGDKNYEYGKTHIGIVDVDENGNKVWKSFTAGKGWRTDPINQKFIAQLPAQITATNPVNPDLNPSKAQEFYQALKNPGKRKTARQFEPYQVASAGGQIPAPPVNPFAEVDELINQQLSEVDALIEGKQPQDPRSAGGWLAPKIAEPDQDTLAQFAAPAGEMIGEALDLPSKYLLRKPLEFLHAKAIEPSRQRTVNEFAEFIQNPGAGAAAPEAFAGLPDQEAFVTPLEIALQPTLFKGLGKLATKGTTLPQKIANTMYESAIKVPPKTPNWLRKKVVKTGLDEKINVSQKGLDTLYGEINSLNDQIALQIADGNGINISGENIAKRLDTLRNYYNDSLPNVREQALKILDNLEIQMVNEGLIPLKKAQRMKQQTYKDIKKAYAPNAGMQGPEIEGMKQLARGLKEEIATSVPGIAPLNAKESQLLDLAKFLDPAVNRVGNYDLLRMGDAIGTVMGGSLGGPHGAAAGLAARRIIDTPAVKAKLAIWLNSINKGSLSPDMLRQLQTAAPFMAASNPLFEEK